MCFDSKIASPRNTPDGPVHQKQKKQHVRRGGRGYQEGGHIVLPEGGQQRLEDIQDVAPVRAQLSCVGPTCRQQACFRGGCGCGQSDAALSLGRNPNADALSLGRNPNTDAERYVPITGILWQGRPQVILVTAAYT